MVGFEQTVTAQKQDTGVVLNDSVNYTILFHSKKKKGSDLMFGITRQRMEGQTEIIIRPLFKSMFQLHLEYYLKF